MRKKSEPVVEADPSPGDVDMTALKEAIEQTADADADADAIETERDYTQELERELVRTQKYLEDEIARLNRLLVDAMHAESAVNNALTTVRTRRQPE